jgi:RNA polymerase sigma-70 factor (ECF subfamily)
MLRVKDGDEQAFRALFGKHAAPLVAFADRFFHNRAQSEEAVQEVFLKVYRARRRYQPQARFSTWLYTIATRTCLNLLRGRPARAAEPLQEDSMAEGHSPIPAADQVLEGRRLQECVQAVLDRLPENQRAAMLLVRFTGRTYAEVARILGTTEAAVKSLLFRATEEVRTAVERLSGTEGAKP